MLLKEGKKLHIVFMTKIFYLMLKQHLSKTILFCLNN